MFYEYHRSVGVDYLYVSKTSAQEFDFPLHLHQSFELVCVEKGVLQMQIAGAIKAVGRANGKPLCGSGLPL